MLDGAHTAESATAFAQTLRQYFPDAPVALVLAMASDKNHKAVMKALHQSLEPDIVLFTSVPIAGAEDRYDSDDRLNICANAITCVSLSQLALLKGSPPSLQLNKVSGGLLP